MFTTLEPEERIRNAASAASTIELALKRKFWIVPPEEISIAISEALTAYCEAAISETLDDEIENPKGYLWRVAERAIRRYLLYINREPLMGDEQYVCDGEDKSLEMFELKDAITKILQEIRNESYRTILELHYLKELSFEEIAKQQGKNIRAVHKSHERAIGEAKIIAYHFGILSTPPPRAIIGPSNPKIILEKIENSVSHFPPNRYFLYVECRRNGSSHQGSRPALSQ